MGAEKDAGAPVDGGATITKVGEQVQKLRAKRKLTLQGLSRETGLSASMLSLVERGKTSPSIGTLVALASALGVQVSDLFDDSRELQTSPLRSVREQPVYVTADGVSRRSAWTDPIRGVELGLTEYEVGSGTEDLLHHHSGFEYGIVIEGRLTVELEGESHELRAGDCIAYDSRSVHRVINRGRGRVRALWVNLGR